MGYRQYTHCVQPADYVDDLPPNDTLTSIAEFLTDPTALARWAAAFCPYLLGGKLVCLGDGSDQCAIGRITHFEPPSEKSFPDNIDNDFSMNILLAPHDIEEMTGPDYLPNYTTVANDGMQGRLMQEQPGMPVPHQAGTKDNGDPPGAIPSPRYQGYFTKYPDSNYPAYDPSHSPFQVPGSDGHPFYVPCLHVECEGSRISDVCSVIGSLLGPFSPTGPLSDFCDIPIIGWITCGIIELVTTLVLAPVIAGVWAAAHDGDQADARVDGGGTLGYGDLIVVTGRWVYDGGHQGWNELHPVKTIQKIPPENAAFGTDFSGWHDRWCNAIAASPPYEGPGQRPSDMSPAQTTTYNNQTEPENQWIFHPAVDGCLPAESPPRLQ